MVRQTPEQTYQKLLDEHYLPTFQKYLQIKNSSSLFKSEQPQDDAIKFLVDWVYQLKLENTIILKFQEKKLPPALVIITEPKREEKTVMFYGFLDKQPAMKSQWSKDKSAYEPTIEDGRLYGRGATEGAGNFIASALMIKAFQMDELSHDRIVLFFETDKHSGSCDAYFFYLKHKDLIMKPDIIYCMDSTVADYNNLYFTNSLKGNAVFDLKVSVGKTGVHSGLGGGLVPDSYRILVDLLSRFENSQNGRLAEELYEEVPPEYYSKLQDFFKKHKINYQVKYKDSVKPKQVNFKNFVKNIWDPSLATVAQDNIPIIEEAGNVLRACTTFRFKLNTCPLTTDKKIEELLNQNFKSEKALYNAKVDLNILTVSGGFYQLELKEDLQKIVNDQCKESFQKEAVFWGTGDSIPFLAQIKKKNPLIDVVLTGVKSFDSNSKSGNENLNMDYAGKVYKSMFSIVNNAHKL